MKSMLAITSSADPAWLSGSHNPADFMIDMTNTSKMHRIIRIAPVQVAIPRLFPNISEYNNTLVFYGRRVVEEKTGLSAPNDWIRTASLSWEERLRIVIPEGIYNIDQLMAIINPQVASLGQVWRFNIETLTIEIEATAPGPQPYTFGYFTPAPVTPIDAWVPLVYVSGGQSELLNTLGLEAAAFTTSVGFSDNVPFDRLNPNSFDSTRGTILDRIPSLPLFNRESHSYEDWLASEYKSPLLNRPNLAGPESVHVVISELGDSSTVNAATGGLHDVVTTVEMTTAAWNERTLALLRDTVAEAIDFQRQRSVTGFRVRILDSKFRKLKLPRNSQVDITLAVWSQHD